MDVVSLLVGMLIGAVLMAAPIFVWAQRQSQRRYDDGRASRDGEFAQTELRASAAESALKDARAVAQSAAEARAALAARMDETAIAHAEKLRWIESAREQLAQQFQALAATVLEQKAERFSAAPVNGRIAAFRPLNCYMRGAEACLPPAPDRPAGFPVRSAKDRIMVSSIGSNSMASMANVSRHDPSRMASTDFSKLDTEGQGYIEASDLQSALSQISSTSSASTESDSAALFKALDGDSDGKVTESEFSSACRSWPTHWTARPSAAEWPAPCPRRRPGRRVATTRVSPRMS